MNKRLTRLGWGLAGLCVVAGGIWLGLRSSGVIGTAEDPSALGEGSAAGAQATMRPAPDFELKSADGKSHKLSELKGQAVVVHFWAAWCPPCLGEIPNWLEFARKWEGKSVRFVAISLDKSWDEAHKILPDAELPKNVLSLLDLEQTLPDRFGTYQYPETYLLTPDHKIAVKWVGPQEWASPGISATVEHAINAK
jgi:thiol-disulfide isomerase/thioredoxin